MCAAQRPLQETSDLIGEIYDAALDPSCWQVVLQHLVDGFDCTSALIRILDPDHAKVDFSFTCGFTTHCLRAYAEHFVRVDPFVQALNRKPIGHIGVSQEVLSDRELQRTEYFNDYMRPHGRFHLAGGYVVREQGRVVQFALQRERRAGAFDERNCGCCAC